MLSACVSESPQPISQAENEYANRWSLIEATDFPASRTENHFLIDVRRSSDFEGGHIPGAANVWRNQITDTSYAYGGMMATKSQMESLLSELGAQPSDTLILYDAKANVDAVRLWWILYYYGHEYVRLLNGGLKAWQADFDSLEYGSRTYDPADFRFIGEAEDEILASIDLVKEVELSDSIVLIDTRTTEEFSGEKLKKGAAWPGRIESSVNLDWAESVDYSGDHKFLSRDSLAAKFQRVGIDGTKPVITYCHSGVRSAHTLFVLTQLLGYENVKNYDGSWTEWSHLNPPADSIP